jgi:hypothetical protein
MSCARCSSDDLVQIELAPAGRALRFATCRRCEHRWWTDLHDEQPLPLSDVLATVSRR